MLFVMGITFWSLAKQILGGIDGSLAVTINAVAGMLLLLLALFVIYEALKKLRTPGSPVIPTPRPGPGSLHSPVRR